MDKMRKGFIERGKTEFNFNIEKEVIEYKVASGERLFKDDKKYIDDYNQKCQDTNGEKLQLSEEYVVWKNNFIKKYIDYPQDKLDAFLFHLKHGAKVQKRIKEVAITLITPVIVGVVLCYFEKFFIKDMESYLYSISLIGFLVLFFVYFMLGMKLLEKYNIKQEVYEKYAELIEEIIKKR